MRLTCRIPLMAMTAQFYFGKRAWLLWGKKTWIKWFFIIVPTITMLCGVAYVFLSAWSSLHLANRISLAITARIWSEGMFKQEIILAT